MGFSTSIVVLTLLLVCLSSLVIPDKGAYTGYVNLEKLYTLEDELIAVSDVILNQEKVTHGSEDVHGIYNITSIVTKVKDIHRDIVSTRNMTSYIVHPINIYHMTKRLVKEWSKVVANIEDSQSCAKVMRLKIENMADNIPTGTNLKQVVEGILRLQAFYNISVNDVISGKILNTSSKSQMSLDEAFEFARVAYETEKYYLAVEWLKYVTEMYDENIANFNLSNAMNLLSSAYFKSHRPKSALTVLDRLLAKEPNSIVANRNSKFLIQKIDEGMKEIDVVTQAIKGKKERLLQKQCGMQKDITYGSNKLFCYYSSSGRKPDLFHKPTVKTEILSRRPLIVLYYDIVTPSEQKALAHLGYEQMKEVMYRNRYTHPHGMSGMAVEDRTHWQWVPKLQRTLEDLPVSLRYPEASQLVIKNVGMDGLENSPLDRAERNRLGTFLVFLSEPSYGGGDIAFPFAKVRVKPRRGNVLFYERTAHKQATICPVISDTEWIGVYPLHDQMSSSMCYKDLLLRPQQK